MKRADGRRYGWVVRSLSVVLAISLLLGIVSAGLTLRGEGWAADQRDGEAYQYLKARLTGLGDGWAARAVREIKSWFSGGAGVQACYQKAAACLNRGDEDGALSWLQKAIEQGATDKEKAEANLCAACLSGLTGRYGAAASYADTAAALAPEDAQTQWLTYRFHVSAGDTSGAARALAAYAGLSGEKERYSEAARLATQEGDHAAAIRYYSMAMHGGKTDELLYLRGTSYQQNGEYEAAAADFALSAYPGSLYALGMCEWTLGRTDDAARHLNESIARKENANDARSALAIISLQSGAYKEAEALIGEYLAQGGAYADIAYYRGSARALSGDYAGAIADFDAAALTETFADEGLFGSAQCRFLAGEYQGAVERLKRCVEKGVFVLQSRYYLGLSYARLGDADNAEEQLKLALGE